MIKVQTTPLNANVSGKYNQVAFFEASRTFSNFIRSDGSLHTRDKSKVSNRPVSSSIGADPAWPPRCSQTVFD
jgi:hypothetical protein